MARRNAPQVLLPEVVEEVDAADSRIRPGHLDLLAALGATLAAGALFFTTFSGDVALGDAQESVAGIKTLGILHAPGYPAYVLSGRAFAAAVHFGSWAWRVNLFSLVCASLTVGVVVLLARRFGASRTGAIIGALTLATTASYWYNAGYAKHYPLSALLVSASALFVVAWEQDGRALYLVLGAMLLGLCVGASWQLAAIMFLGFVVLIATGTRRPRWQLLLPALGAGLLVVVALFSFIVVRAHQDPQLNWGDATTAQHLKDLLAQKDFRLGTTSTQNGSSVLSRAPGRTTAYLGVLERDIGLGAAAFAVLGAFAVVRRSGRNRAWFLLVVGGANIIAAVYAAGLERIAGFGSGLTVGGFLIDAFVVIAILVALGVSEALEAVADWAHDDTSKLRARGLTPRRVGSLAVAGIAIVVLLPSVIVHYNTANHRVPAFTDLYAKRVLAALPQDAVLIVGGYGYGLPEVYRQLVDDERPDVTVIDGDMTVTPSPWYAGQLTRRLDLGDTLRPATGLTPLNRLIAFLGKTRPVYLDTTAMGIFRDGLGYQANGFVAKAVEGTGAHPGTGLDDIAAGLARADVEDHVTTQKYNGFANGTIYILHERAHIELAKQYFAAHRTQAAIDELQRAVDILPDPASSAAIEHLRQNAPDLEAEIARL